MARRLQAEWSAPAPAPSTSSAFSDPFGTASAPSVASSGPGLVPPFGSAGGAEPLCSQGRRDPEELVDGAQGLAGPGRQAAATERLRAAGAGDARPLRRAARAAVGVLRGVVLRRRAQGAVRGLIVLAGRGSLRRAGGPVDLVEGLGILRPVRPAALGAVGELRTPSRSKATPSRRRPRRRCRRRHYRTRRPPSGRRARRPSSRPSPTGAPRPRPRSRVGLVFPYETDSESDEESSASEESPVKAPRPSDNSELMNRFRSRLQGVRPALAAEARNAERLGLGAPDPRLQMPPARCGPYPRCLSRGCAHARAPS